MLRLQTVAYLKIKNRVFATVSRLLCTVTSTSWSVHSGFGMNTPFFIQFLRSEQVLSLLTFLMRSWLWGYIPPPRLFLYQPCNSPACQVTQVRRQSDSK